MSGGLAWIRHPIPPPLLSHKPQPHNTRVPTTTTTTTGRDIVDFLATELERNIARELKVKGEREAERGRQRKGAFSVSVSVGVCALLHPCLVLFLSMVHPFSRHRQVVESGGGGEQGASAAASAAAAPHEQEQQEQPPAADEGPSASVPEQLCRYARVLSKAKYRPQHRTAVPGTPHHHLTHPKHTTHTTQGVRADGRAEPAGGVDGLGRHRRDLPHPEAPPPARGRGRGGGGGACAFVAWRYVRLLGGGWRMIDGSRHQPMNPPTNRSHSLRQSHTTHITPQKRQKQKRRKRRCATSTRPTSGTAAPCSATGAKGSA